MHGSSCCICTRVRGTCSALQANREAPTLAFSKPRGAAGPATTTAALTAQFQPQTDMEAEVAAMLRSAGVDSGKAVQEGEDALALKVPLHIPLYPAPLLLSWGDDPSS